MVADECGFLYPKIDDDLCVGCRKCTSVCAFQNISEENTPLSTYAAVSKNKEQAVKSASGGIFASLAEDFINKVESFLELHLMKKEVFLISSLIRWKSISFARV